MKTERLKEFSITSWCIDNATSIYVFIALIVFAGGMIYQGLPKELYPDVVVPTISIVTIYPGATPEDIENLITKQLEKQVKSLKGVKKVTSNSLSDVSIMTVEFGTNLDPTECKQRVTDAVDKGKKDLPSDLDNDPQVQEFDINELPIMNINLAGDIPLSQIKDYAEDLKDRIEGMKQITRVDIIGGLDREIQINVDLYKMTNAGITLMDIENAVQRENLNVSGGEVRVDQMRRNLRIAGEFRDPNKIKEMVIRSFTGTTVFLKDIATVEDAFKEKQDFAHLDNKSVITLNIIKRSGENLIEATDEIYKVIDEYKATQFPEGLNVKVTGDTSEKTRVQLHDLLNTVILGFIFVVFILMFFMGFSNAFFVGLSVPLTTLVAFLFMPGLGMTMNVMVLFSLLLALGIVVDDAIVVIENTHRIYNKYEYDIKQSAKYAAGEVFVPVLAGTLTTLAPFFPLLFWPGIVGKFMGNLPVTLIITLGASLFVAFVMNPVFAVSFMKKDDHGAKSKLMDYKYGFILFGLGVIIGYPTGYYGVANFSVFMLVMLLVYHFAFSPAIIFWQNRFWPKVTRGYRKILSVFIVGYRPVFVPLAAIVLLIGSFAMFAATKPQVEFFPNGEPNFVYVYCKLPMGTDATVTDSVTLLIEKRIYKVIGNNNPDVTSVITNVGLGAGDPQNPDKVPTPNKSKVTVAFKEYAQREHPYTSEILTKIRNEFKGGVAGAEISVEKEAAGPPVGKPINIEISGDDFAVLDKLSKEMRNNIDKAGIQGIDELRSDLQISKPEIIVDIDREKMQREGIVLGQVAGELRTALFGKEVSKFRDKNDDAPIQLRLRAEDRQRVEQLLNINISYMDMSIGQFRQVPLSAIANVRYDNTISVINRKNQKRVVTLASDVAEGYSANEIIPGIEQVIGGMEIPEGYEIKMTGEQEQQKETGDFLALAFGGAFALMFLILVTQFNSVVKPLIIATTVLFSLVGVAIGYTITGMALSVVMSGVGVFALAGIVIRNGILLIEFIDELRERGMGVEEAVVEGGATRMTPVILTASAAILGLIPLALGLNLDFAALFSELNGHFSVGGDNVAFWGPLAWTMIFGLMAATVLTLLVVPAMYMLGYKTRARFRRRFGKTQPVAETH